MTWTLAQMKMKSILQTCVSWKSNNKVLSSNDESDLYYNELYNAFESLYDEFRKLGHKYSSLEKSHASLLVEKDALEKKT